MDITRSSGSLVSVIIPAFNRAALLPRAIASVRAQTHQHWEVIVVDDGSTDNTREVVESMKDSRVTYCRHTVNRGAGAARNTGLRAARGEWVAFLDSDDWWRPEKLAVQLSVAAQSKQPNLGVVLCGRELRRDNGITFQAPQMQGNQYAKLLYYGMGWALSTSTWLVKHRARAPIALFDEALWHSQDWDYLLRVARTYSVDRTTEPLCVAEKAHGLPKLTDASRAIRIETWRRIARKHIQESRSNQTGVMAHLFLARRYLMCDDFESARASILEAGRYDRLCWKLWLLRLASIPGRRTLTVSLRLLNSLRLLP